MSEPLVSVCIPTYNGRRYLKEALDSVLIQSYPELEVVISDDQSHDNTIEVIHDFIQQTRLPVNFVEHEPRGIGANWNNCIVHARGKYIKFLFQDDVLEPTCIEKMVKVFEEGLEDLGLVYCRKRLIGEFGSAQQEAADRMFTEHSSMSAIEILSNRDLYTQPRNKIGEPSCSMIRKSALDVAGLYSENLDQSLDYELWYRLMSRFEIESIDEALVKFRVHEDQASSVNSKRILPDTYLLPYLLLRDHHKHLHSSAKRVLSYKLLTGLLRYFVLRPLLNLKKALGKRS